MPVYTIEEFILVKELCHVLTKNIFFVKFL